LQQPGVVYESNQQTQKGQRRQGQRGQEMLKTLIQQLKIRICPLMDMSAWLLLIICALPLVAIDRAMIMTLIQWTAYSGALVGITIILTRIIFPQIRLTEYLDLAKSGNLASSIVVLAVSVIIGFIFLGVVLWSKT
jgi:hypothetical protein